MFLIIDNILTDIATLGPVFGLLTVVIIVLNKKLNKAEKQVEDLQKELRQSEKDSLESMLKVLSFLEKADTKEDIQHKELLTKIEQFKNDILVKLAEFK